MTSGSTYGRFQMVQPVHIVHIHQQVSHCPLPLSEEPSHDSPYGSTSEALPHLVLPGHRSIVNQVRYSPTHHLLCSSGVEKIVKVMAKMQGCLGGNLSFLISTQICVSNCSDSPEVGGHTSLILLSVCSFLPTFLLLRNEM